MQKDISEEGSSEVRMRELENLNGKGDLDNEWLQNKGLMIKYSSIMSGSQGTSIRYDEHTRVGLPKVCDYKVTGWMQCRMRLWMRKNQIN